MNSISPAPCVGLLKRSPRHDAAGYGWVLILLAPSVMAQTAADPLSMPAIYISTYVYQTYSVSLQILLLMSAN